MFSQFVSYDVKIKFTYIRKLYFEELFPMNQREASFAITDPLEPHAPLVVHLSNYHCFY